MKAFEKWKFRYFKKFKNRVRLAKIFKLLQLLQQNNLQDLLGESHKKLNVIVATVLLLKKKIKAIFLSQ